MNKLITNQDELIDCLRGHLNVITLDQYLKPYTPAVASLDWEVCEYPEITTAATDGKRVMIDLDYWNMNDGPQQIGVMIHEIHHPMLGHLWRFRHAPDHYLANVACDVPINRLLKVLAELTSAIRFPADPGGGLVEIDDYGDLSEEYILRELLKRKEDLQDLLEGMPASSAGEFLQPSAEPDEDEDEEEGQGGGPGDEGDGQGNPVVIQAGLEQKWTEIRNKVTQSAKCQGNIPGSLIETLEDTDKSYVDWYSALYNFMEASSPTDVSEHLFDRTLMSSGIYVEAMEDPSIACGIFVQDTSYSMGTDWVEQSKSEINYARKELRIEVAYVLDVDTDVRTDSEKGVQRYGPDDELEFVIHGRGGTDFRPPFIWAEEFCEEEPSFLIYFTDGDGPFPKEAPDFPVLWVTFEKEPEHYPFGTVLDMRGYFA